MAATFFWTVTVLISVFLNKCDFQSVAVHSKNGDTPPHKMVEIIELMLSQRPDDGNKNNFGIQKVPQDSAPNYEILITPNKNLPELKGSQKIKIYVEAANFDPDEKTSKSLNDDDDDDDEAEGEREEEEEEEEEKVEKQNIFDVLPLSIESEGGKVDFQQPSIPIIKHINQNTNHEYQSKETGSYPSKRQTNWSSPKIITPVHSEPIFLNHGPEIKKVIIQREPSYVDQNNPHHPVSPTKHSGSDYGVQNANQDHHRLKISPGYIEDYADTVVDQRVRPKIPLENDYQRNYEDAIAEDLLYAASNERSRERDAGYPLESERRHIREQDKRQINEKRPLYDRESDEFKPSSGSRLSTNYKREYDEPSSDYDYQKVKSTNERIPQQQQHSRNSEYEKTRPSDVSYTMRKTDERNNYNKGGTNEYYGESMTDNGSRPIKENSSSYSGFPESHQPDINNHYSRPLQYEPARVFPASPCLKVFKYEGREPEEDRWFADIYVTVDEVLNGMRLDITLDRPAELLTNWIADVKTKDNIHFTLLSLNHKLVPGPAENVRIMVKFNGKKPVPYLKSINLNGRLICPSNRAQKTTTKRPMYENPGDLHLKRTTEYYTEKPKKPIMNYEYESSTKKTTTRLESTVKPPPFLKPNPNGYEETDLNSFGGGGKKPPGRPPHSNGKPPPHAAKPAQGSVNNHGHGQGHGNGNGNGHGQGHGNGNKGNGNKNHGSSSSSSGGNKPNIHPYPNPNPYPSPNPNPYPNPNPPNPQTNDYQRYQECGTPSIQPSPLITHGQLTSRGQWPWHVALYKNVGTDLTFFCGGSLINNKYVLTAAHCVTKTYTTQPLDENTLVVYLGKYHLKLWSEGGVQNRQVFKITVHPKYNSTDFRSDIAVLELTTPVEYSDYVRPICMWDRTNTRIEEVEGKLGTVVGWGFDEHKMLTEELRQAKMPVVEQKTCLWSYPDFYPQFTSNMTYCAGFKNGTSVCNGDSGGGMVFPYKDRTGIERWHLRGIVSISPARNDSRVCDTSHYVVFTDVAKYLPWLDNFI
ncbi:hypothetical protein Phum_PHUM609370 [Pediculus humanus corporis]|uniref:Peptidase S1 domain-containing protein n=1 Tax=Pediculus humanus subsp. corporis TaxID=121224 RepID=E0W3S0_PEDHC|nr:uncharacterized protein Phum_PHUM609370 [Pediculus humanus corporis]EEB20276.1 hypothetical protein Phum_PHUM609370 [Pediculus humanus corporis]